MNSDDLRTLIQRVADAGGPLRLSHTDGLGWRVHWNGSDWAYIDDDGAVGEWDADVLAGVLRRDMVAAGRRVVCDYVPDEGTNDHCAVLCRDPEDHLDDLAGYLEFFGADPLTAHLRCWLDAHEKGLVGRQDSHA